MRFVRLLPDTLLLRDIVEMSQQEYDALVINNPSKAALLRPLVTDPLPTIDPATQKIIAGPIVIEALQARETWTVVAKTASELEADALAAEQSQIADRIDKLNTAINEHQAILDVPYSEPAQAGTNALEITALRSRMKDAERAIRAVEKDLIVTMKSCKWLLRKMNTSVGGSASAAAAKTATKVSKI